MIKLLHTKDPDTGVSIPVVVDSHVVGVSAVSLSRGDSEGNPRALHAVVAFESSEPLPREGDVHLFVVDLHVLTENFAAPMQESQEIKSISGLEPEWDMSTNSSGDGKIHAVHVQTRVHAVETY
ncbi:hypothetical protein LC082_13895 [Microbacterium esteraromaticum]|uniref:hypothetical protein n=1 Tax=Microbacterium esteraromaticum TaxID=57043 RepID=UPI001CD356EC|nr:hypothetical protein [Microbacterium esteraromaticum]MCA1307990.1 hypothetical protein [Microbacterium esteraromaticum]